jgi:hypothetical protein
MLLLLLLVVVVVPWRSNAAAIQLPPAHMKS